MNCKHIPNAITIFRMLLIVPVVWVLLSGDYLLAFFLFVLAGISDGVDGYLARRYQWISRFGAIADPLADKLLVFLTYITLGYLGFIPVWLILVVIFRDVILVAGALLYRHLIEEPRLGSSMLSKINTVLQLILVIVLLFSKAFLNVPAFLITMLMYCVLITTVLSFIDYGMVWGGRAWKLGRRVRT